MIFARIRRWALLSRARMGASATMRDMSRYQIPAARTRVETRAGNSRFITTIDRTDTVAAARAFLKEIRAELPDANHHVYAYIVGFGASMTEGMSDDGEPQGTSGPPTRAVLRGANIGDVTLVTTRYFGGTKLGTGGLVTAYTEAAKAALAALPTEEKVERIALIATIPYAVFERAKLLLADHEARIHKEDFGTDVQLEFDTPIEQQAAITKKLADLTNGTATIEVLQSAKS